MTMPGWKIVTWAAAAVAVTAVAALAIGASVSAGGDALSEDEVATALAADDPTQSPQTSSPGADPTTGATTTALPGGSLLGGEVLRTTPGAVVVRCDSGSATLVSWSPNPGYRADEVVRGPAAAVSVWFESDVANDVKVVATCANGKASVTELVEQDDHGGKDKSGSGTSGSSGRDHPEDS